MMTQQDLNLAIRLSEVLGWSDIQSHIVLPVLEPVISLAHKMGFASTIIGLSKTDLWKHIAAKSKGSNGACSPVRSRTIFKHRLAIEAMMRKNVSYQDACDMICAKYQ